MSEARMDVLEGRFLHKVFLFFHMPYHFPAWLNWLLLALSLGGHYGLWQWLQPGLGGIMTFWLAVFVGGDILLLWQLPRRKLSFGPIGPQLFMMLVPRWGVSVLALGLAFALPIAALGVMLLLQMLGTLLYLWGMVVEPHQLEVTRLALKTPLLPTNAPPIRILHLTDLHLERLTRREEEILDVIARERPDLIVITGDYLNLSYRDEPEAIAQVRAYLRRLHAPHGVFATLGSPPVDLRSVAPRHFDDTDIDLLHRDVRHLDLGQGRRLNLLGLDCTHDLVFDAARFSELDSRRDEAAFSVLLYHSPEAMPFVKKSGVNLFLCGHTHGGQVRLPLYGALLTSSVTGKRYEMGRYDEEGTTLYVSRGIGLEGMTAPRIRLLCPPEVTMITLTGI